MIIPFAPWAPDLYNLDAAVAGEASGVLPGRTSYTPWMSLAAVSIALAAVCRGAITVRKSDGTYLVYAGTATKLYRFASTTAAWTDVSRLVGGAYNLPDDEYWSFTQFGSSLIAVNANDVAQVINTDTEVNFTALGGSPPQCRFVKSAGDQVFLMGLVDYPNRLQWSGRNDPTYWTSGSRDADFQDFPDGGWVNGVSSLETGLIFQKNTIRRFQPVTDRSIFAFSKVEDSRGLLAPNSLVVKGRTAYYLSEDGFFATDGSGASREIGADKITKWVQSNINYSRQYAVVGAADPVHPRIFWLFPTTGNSTYVLDHMLCYDISLDRWTHAEVSASYILEGATAGITLDALDAAYPGYTLDTLPFSLDSQFLKGGSQYLAAFNSDFKLAFFSGANLAATVETSTFQITPEHRSLIRGVRPRTDTTSATIAVGSAERPQDALSYGAASAINTQGYCPTRSSGRFHRVRASIPAGTSWTHLSGVEPDVVQDGER